MKRILVEFGGRSIRMSLPSAGVLTAAVSLIDHSQIDPICEDMIRLHLGGLDFTDNTHPLWGNFDLQPGDVITISIHDDRESDPPLDRSAQQPATKEELKERVRIMTRQLGWQVIESESDKDPYPEDSQA